MSKRRSRRRKTKQASATSSSTKSSPTTSHSDSKKLDRILQNTIAWLFNFLVLSVPFFFFWVNEELFEFNKMLLTYGITVLIISAWFVRMIVVKKVVFRRSILQWPILIFVLSQVITTVTSMHPRTSFFGYYTRFHGGLLSTLTYAGLYFAFVSNISKQQVRGFLLATLTAAAGVSLYAIPEHFGASPSCSLIIGEFNTECWVQDVQSRIFGTFGQPNWLAAYAVTLLPVSLALFVTVQNSLSELKKRASLAVYGLAFLGLYLSLLFTKSRSGFLAFVVGMGMFLLCAASMYLKNKTNHGESVFSRPEKMKVGAAAIAIVALATAAFGSPFTPTIGSLFKNSQPSQQAAQETEAPSAPAPVVNRLEVGGTDSGEIRRIVWQGAIDIWKRYPVFGSGVETFAYSYYLDRPVEHNMVSEWDFLYNKAHNELLNYLATTGLVGTIPYLLLMASLVLVPLLPLVKKETDSPDLALLGVAISSGIIALSVSNFFGFSTVMVTILMYLLPAAFLVLQRKEKVPEIEIKETGLVQIAGAAAVCFVGLLSLSTVFGWWRADFLYAQGKQLLRMGQLSESVILLRESTNLVPGEALFHDQLAQAYAEIAVTLDQQGSPEDAAAFEEAAILASQRTLTLNPVHNNFYKSQARTYIILASLDESYLEQSLAILEAASQIAPTDAKVWYNIALLQISLDRQQEAIETLQKTIDLKPNYEQARLTLAEQYELEGAYQEALVQYEAVLTGIAPNNSKAASKAAALRATTSATLSE